jgi:hypothetical protein
MTMSKVLKFLLQLKQRARLVFGFVAVWQPEQRGHRNLKIPSLSLAARAGSALMSLLMGMAFLRI